jgi:hypothetical protein
MPKIDLRAKRPANSANKVPASEPLTKNRTVSADGAAGLTAPCPTWSWILERSATRLREADLNVFSKLGNQGLEWRLEPEAFAGREVRREDDLLDVLVGYPVDIEVARQPSK